jgi:DNA topoisomerase VI subunit A
VILWPEKNIINESKGKVMSDLRISFEGDGKLKSNCLHKDSVDKAMLIA